MKSIVTYHIFSPGGNTTALVTLSPRGKRGLVTQLIMRKHPQVEQVGFITFPKSETLLTMPGNELCINATRCALLLTAMRTGCLDVSVRVSGVKKMIRGHVRFSRVVAELPYDIVRKNIAIPDGSFVHMRGIRFVVTNKKLNRSRVKRLLTSYNAHVPAIGVVRAYKHSSALHAHRIDPWVWVKKTNTLVHETGCGSGSIALCVASMKSKNINASCTVVQPSGAAYLIRIKQKKNISIKGPIRYIGAETITL